MRDKVQSSVPATPGGRQDYYTGGAGAKQWQDAAAKSGGLWRSSFTKKVFLATIVVVACMLVFRAKEAVWCLSNDCGIGGVRGLDFSVMQKALDLHTRSIAPVQEQVRSEGVASSAEQALAPLLPPGSIPETGLERGCQRTADCPGEKLCLLEACVCPVLYSGDSMCRTPTPGMAAGCITPITSRRLPLFAQGRNISLPGGTQQVNSSSAGNAQGLWSNIQDITDFSTCAVVGSSSSVLKDSGRLLGTEIDEHSVVIRFNDAPTQGFEKWVGSRTTLRIQNVIYCGFREHPAEFCFRYTSKERKNGHIEMAAKNAFHCRPINGTSEMLLYAMAYWQLSSIVVEHDAYDQPAVPWDKSLRKMSAGFFGIALAAHLCGKVDVYGVESGELHYYVKRPNLKHKAKSQCTLAGCKSKRTFSQRHSWNQESKCLGHIRQGGLPRVHIRT